ncbi:hypothetical protein V9T40_010824 [Parthenolecanium corni]|uniref:C2H2-type domain-containing protein n=1 Tax=Parthenolecanium corni TaxID=536013 RepID=A0AAN9T844_9HEMI
MGLSVYESLTCNVCDRSFYNRKSLEQHQQKKRHFGCSACDTLFPSVMQLEHHKEEFDHWSDSETSALTCHYHHHHNCHEADDDFDDDDDSYIESCEEMERLL